MIWGGVLVGCSPRLLAIPFTLTLALSHQGRGEYFLCPTSLASRVRGNDGWLAGMRRVRAGMRRVRAGMTPLPCPSPGIPCCPIRSPAPFALRKGRGVCLRLRFLWFRVHPLRRAYPACEGGFETRS